MNIGHKKFEATCSYCDIAIKVPFKPDAERNVYCREKQECRTKDQEYRKANPNIYEKFKKKINPLKPAEEPKPADDEKTIEIKIADKPAEEPEIDKLKKRLTEYQYHIAELQNTQKRRDKETEQKLELGNIQIIQNIIPIYENLVRLVDNSPNDSSTKALTMIIKDIKSLLAKQSVEFIQAEGNPFDPLLHDADDFTENSDFDDNVVVQEIQRGYKIHGNVVRPSKVIVNKNTVSSSVDINE